VLKLNKNKIFLVHAMKVYGGRADIAQIIIKLGPHWRGMLSFRPPPLTPV
jgi:hypothetical protein